MSVAPEGYRFSKLLRSSTAARVWSATREADQKQVVAKVFAIEDRAGLEARVEHEFELIRQLELPGVVRALALERSGRDLVLVLEAHEGVNLAEHTEGRAMTVDEFLPLAARLAAILADVHAQRVIHRDIKPTNILINPETGEVALADFGISVLLESERAQIHDREVIEGSLPYMAPEQTGRTGAEVDFRSDLYSLGVTFYELLTGRRPFEASSPLELIHAHLARRAEPPQRLRPELPTLLSDLVMKLLEKAPERRYQSARGLAADLERLLANRLEHPGGGTVESFELGHADVPTQLRLPHQLYGRERERAELLEAFSRVSAGAPGFALIIGEPGIGKSALLDELIEPVFRMQGFLARGKFEAGSEQPYAAVSAALSSLADQLLTEPGETLATWRAQLHTALGGLVPVLCALVPRFARVLGDPGQRRALPPAEARNQVRIAFARLLTRFARPEHPLVLALDDLQWADSSSLELLDSVLAEPKAAIFVVATARTEARSSPSEVPELLARLEASGRDQLELQLGPLDRPALTRMIADVLSRAPEEVASLTEVVARKTGSNPFFARQFLLHLADLGLVTRGPEGWTWDPAALEAASLPEDALEMMTAKLARLPADVRELVTVASVFGAEFDPFAVERVGGGTWAGAKFHRLVDEGLIAPVSGRGYVFGHDRIREAAYQMLGPERRRALHLAIGEDLLARVDPVDHDELGQRVFELVDHLDRGHGLVGTSGSTGEPVAAAELDARIARIEPTRLRRLAALNVRAGHLALASGAPTSALTHLELGARLVDALGEFPGRDQPGRELAFQASFGLAQAQSLVGLYFEAEARLVALLERELGYAERSQVAVARIWTLLLAGRREQALRFGCEVLRSLGVALPERVGVRDVARILPRMLRMARPDALERVRAQAPITDARVLAALGVMDALVNTSYMVEPLTFVVLTQRHAELLERHGDHPSASQIFAQLGLVLANALGRRREAVELARVALELERRRGGGSECYRVLISAQFISQWTEPYHTLLEPLREAIELAQEHGDLESADYAWAIYVQVGFYAGVHLRVLEKRTAARIAWAQQWGTECLGGGGRPYVDACRWLADGPVPARGSRGLLSSRSRADRRLGEVDELATKLLDAMVLAVFGCWRATLTLLEEIGSKLDKAVPGMCYSLVQSLLTGVAAAALAGETGPGPRERRRLRRLLRRQRDSLARWTAKGGNFAYAVALLDAELARLNGELDGAMDRFAEARELAAAQRNPWLEALVCERTAAALLARGQPRLALGPLLDARERYSRWGAFAKVAELDARWPELAGLAQQPRPADERTSETSSGSTTSQALDTATLLQVSQAIAEDIELTDVVERVMALAVENAGAERGALLLADHGRLVEHHLCLAAECDEQGTLSYLDDPAPLGEVADRLPASVLRWVERTCEPVVLDEAGEDLRFSSEPYFIRSGARSVLCAPIVKYGRLIGVLYLENRLSGGCFTEERLQVLRLLTAQAASALENARLYDDLRASEVRWRSLVEQLPDYVVLVDRHGEVEFVNRGARSDAEGLERNPLDFLDAPSEQAAAEALARVFATGRQEMVEVEGRSEAGDPHAFAVRLAPIVIDEGIARVIVVATDISERKQLEAQMRQQQRLESLGTLAAGVAHEINNPVQGIMNYAELIAGSEGVSAMVREFAGEIEHETNRVATIVRNLLRFSRQEQHEAMEELSVAAVVEGTVSLLRAVLRRSQIKLELELPDDLPKLTCRPQQIQQVVMNLVANARDALDQRYGGFHEDKLVTITGEAFEREERPWVRIAVSDRGGGVPEQLAGRIFDPFFTTKGRDRGTGLGLAVSHGIIREHGGDLRLVNRPGHGATFLIELPCSPG